MKAANTFAEYVRNNKAANIIEDVRRVLGSVHGVSAVRWATESQLLAYAKQARMLDEDELLVCQAVYGSF